MNRQASRRFGRVAGLVGIVSALALTLVPTAGPGGAGNGLSAFLRLSNRGPLPACSGADCTAANRVWSYVYVANTNDVPDLTRAPGPGGGRTRATVPDAFVVNSVDLTAFIDGVEDPEARFTFTPPPNAFLRGFSGHWPATVTCPPGADPCNIVSAPAVLPGERTAVVYIGWVHLVGEPNGKHVLQFTIHGTLNGTPVDLTARSKPILMTDQNGAIDGDDDD